MTTNHFFIQEHLGRSVFHGGIGNVDAEKIFIKNGFIPIYFPYHYSFSLRAKLARIWYLIKTCCTLPRNASVIFQFPLYAGMDRLLVRLLKFRKSIRLICFITDIDGIKDGDDALLQEEIAQLRSYHYFIVHNEAMRQWLITKHIDGRISLIDFFDFLAPPVMAGRKKSNSIVFAGNLEKSGFLERLGQLQPTCPNIVFNVYGRDASPLLQSQSNVQYKGFADPYLLPATLEGSFGLVWDGNDIDNPRDSLGNYMRYISHHKLSLYILSGLPVITWSQAGSASLVDRYKIGITINSLFELESVINKISEDEYRQMTANTNQLAMQISNGQRLENAIDELMLAEPA